MSLIIVAALAAASPAPVTDVRRGDSETKVKVGNGTYRVRVRDGLVWVYNKSIVIMPTPADFERRREAVRKATGCEITGDQYMGTALAGTLTCPK